MNNPDLMIKYIRNEVSKQSLWTQIAEEAMEVAHAALKIARNHTCDNPTSVLPEDAMQNFKEELGDLNTTLFIAGVHYIPGEPYIPNATKLERWFTRLFEYELTELADPRNERSQERRHDGGGKMNA